MVQALDENGLHVTPVAMDPFDEIALLIEMLPLPAEDFVLRVRQLMAQAFDQPAATDVMAAIDSFYCDLERLAFQTDTGNSPTGDLVAAKLIELRALATRVRSIEPSGILTSE